MNVKQLKDLRKSQHEVMQPLRRQLDEDAWQRLNEYISSVMQLVKDTNDTREERLLAENECLKRQLAEGEKQHREEIARIRQACSEELTAKVSGIEAKYHRKTAETEARVAQLEHMNELAAKRVLQINEIACTTKALDAAKSRFGEGALPRLVNMAIDVTALAIEQKKEVVWAKGEFGIAPYFTDKGWNVFICRKGELSNLPTILTVSDNAIKRAMS
jgi:hypothetical protein